MHKNGSRPSLPLTTIFHFFCLYFYNLIQIFIILKYKFVKRIVLLIVAPIPP